MLFLGGGGSASDEGRLWVEAFPPGSRVAVLPYAQAGSAAQATTVSWLTSELTRLGEHAVVAARTAGEVADADVVAVPGGNTFLLLTELRRIGLTEAIGGLLARGGSFYGGSAGAVLAGADIDIAAIADANDVGLMDTRGLDLLRGADVLPHFTSGWADVARTRAHERGRTVVCIPERAGVVVDGSTARNVGPEDVRVVTVGGEHSIGPGASWRLDADR